MPRWIVPACVLALVACQEPQPRKQVDPDLWDPRHEALINQEEPPPEYREPKYARASRSATASTALGETGRENTGGVKGLRKAEAQQRQAAQEQSAHEQRLQEREQRWVDRQRGNDADSFAVEELALRATLVRQRTLGVLLEQALAHGVAQGNPRRTIRCAERRATELSEEATGRRERARRAESDAQLQRRLHDSGSGKARASLRAQRKAHDLHLSALRAEEAALRAGEAARRLRQAIFDQ